MSPELNQALTILAYIFISLIGVGGFLLVLSIIIQVIAARKFKRFYNAKVDKSKF